MLPSSFSWPFIRRIRPRGRWNGFSYRPFSIITFGGTTFSISNRFTCLLCAGPSPTSSCYSELLIISNLIFITFRVITYLHIWTNKILVNAFTTLLLKAIEWWRRHDSYFNTYLLDYPVDWEHAFLFWPHLWLGPNSIHAHLQMISETRIEDFLPCLFFLLLCLRSLEFWYACLEKMIHSNLSWCSPLHNSFECRHHNLKL